MMKEVGCELIDGGAQWWLCQMRDDPWWWQVVTYAIIVGDGDTK